MVVLEEEKKEMLKKNNEKQSIEEEAVAAAKAAAIAAADAARASQEMLIATNEGRFIMDSNCCFVSLGANEFVIPDFVGQLLLHVVVSNRGVHDLLFFFFSEKRFFEELISTLNVQVREMKTMSNSIKKLEEGKEVSYGPF